MTPTAAQPHRKTMSSSFPSTHGETNGSGMDGSDSSCSLVVPRLPDDALVEILSRLRAKALCRSKCVSKPWCDLIADRLGCKDLPQSLHGFLCFHGGSRGGGDGSSSIVGAADANGGDDPAASNRDDGGMLLRDGNGRFINLLGKTMPVLDPSFTFLKEQPGIQAIELLDSCNGLLLFGHSRVSDTFHSLGYIVCNPITEQWVAVPSTGWTPTPPEEIVDEREKAVRTFLIFDPSVSSHFELVQFWQDEMAEDVEAVHIYSSETSLWSDRLSELYGVGGGYGSWGVWGAIEKPRSGGRAFVNGKLHILVYNPWQDRFDIFSVDAQANECRLMSWPDQRPFPLAASIGQSQGHLHCISSDHGDPGLSIWVLEDYDTKEWVLKHKVSFSQLFEGIMGYKARFGCVFAGLHPDRNLIFFAQCVDRSLISYDMDSREVCVLCTDLGQRFYVTPYVPSFKSL